MSVAVPRKLYQPLAIAVALAFVYFTVLLKLGGDWWNDENYSHGLLIPFIIGYILWLERKRFSEAGTRPDGSSDGTRGEFAGRGPKNRSRTRLAGGFAPGRLCSELTSPACYRWHAG